MSQYSVERLERDKQVLDLDDGKWTWRQTGKRHKSEVLTSTKFRDRLRSSPIVDVEDLTP